MVRLKTTDGTNTKELTLKPDGTLTWGGVGVLTGSGSAESYGGHIKANGCLIIGGTIVTTSTETLVTFPIAFAEYPALVVSQQDGNTTQSINVVQPNRGINFKITRTNTSLTRFNFVAIGKQA